MVPWERCAGHVRVGHVRRRRGPRPLSTGGTRAVVLECNARTTMSHIALAAKRRVPNAARFLVLPKRDVAPHHLPLTDGEHFVAVLELGDDSGPFPFVDDPDDENEYGSLCARSMMAQRLVEPR